MIRLQPSINKNSNSGGGAFSSSYRESPLRRVLKLGRNTPARGLYDDLASFDSSDELVRDIQAPSPYGVGNEDKLDVISKRGSDDGDKRKATDKLSTVRLKDNKPKADEPGVQGITSAIEKLLYVLSSDDEEAKDHSRATQERVEAPSPASSPPIRKRRKPRLTPVTDPRNIDTLEQPSRHIMTPRRRPRTKTAQSSSKGGDRLCQTDHEAVNKKKNPTRDEMKSQSAHPMAQERSHKVKEERKSAEPASPKVKSGRKSSHSASSRDSNKTSSPRTTCSPNSSSSTNIRKVYKSSPRSPSTPSKELAAAMLQGPPLLVSASPRQRARRRSSTGSTQRPLTYSLANQGAVRRSPRRISQPQTPIRRSKPRRASNSRLTKVEEALHEHSDDNGATQQQLSTPRANRAPIRPKRRSSLYISLYGATAPLADNMSLLGTPPSSWHRQQEGPPSQPCGTVQTSWVPSPSGHRRHLEISWDGNNSAPSSLTASDVSESTECYSLGDSRTDWVPSSSGHRRHLEISWN